MFNTQLTPEQIEKARQLYPQGARSLDPMSRDKLSDDTAPYKPPVKKEEPGMISSFAKSLASPVATMAARPLQAAAEIVGVPDETVNEFSDKISGGLIAPTPQGAGDVMKDVGRGVQTAALGLASPTAAGAAFGAGMGLEDGDSVGGIVVDAALGAAGGKALDVMGRPIFNAAGKVIGKVTPQYLQGLAAKGGTALSDFAAAHDILPGELSAFITRGAQKVSQGADDAMGALTSKAKDVASTAKGKVVSSKPNDLEALSDKIAPKMTKRETQRAYEEGRYFKGDEAGILKSGRPDRVAPDAQQAKSVQTINRLIPDHAKMDEPTLYAAAKDEIKKMSDALRPELRAAKIDTRSVKAMDDEWMRLKEAEAADYHISKNVDVASGQKYFEKVLKDAKKGTLDDVWEARIKYDESIPPRVKNADDSSPIELQDAKDLWLARRRILTDTINDDKNALSVESRKKFSDMRDLYEAQKDILTKAKFDPTVKDAKIKGAAKAAGSVLMHGTVGGGVGGAAASHLIK